MFVIVFILLAYNIIPIVSDTGGSGFRSLYNNISLMYNATNDTLNCGKFIFTLGNTIILKQSNSVPIYNIRDINIWNVKFI